MSCAQRTVCSLAPLLGTLAVACAAHLPLPDAAAQPAGGTLAATAMAAQAGAVHSNPQGVDCAIEDQLNLDIFCLTPAMQLEIIWYGGWHYGDGDQNGEVNIADLTPMGRYFGLSTADDWAAVRADYDHNTEVNITDLTAIGAHFGEATDSYRLEASDAADGAARVLLWEAGWTDGTPYDSAAVNAFEHALYPAFTRWRFYSALYEPSDYPLEQLYELDQNGDGAIRIYLTPQRSQPASSGPTSIRDVYLNSGD